MGDVYGKIQVGLTAIDYGILFATTGHSHPNQKSKKMENTDLIHAQWLTQMLTKGRFKDQSEQLPEG